MCIFLVMLYNTAVDASPPTPAPGVCWTRQAAPPSLSQPLVPSHWQPLHSCGLAVLQNGDTLRKVYHYAKHNGSSPLYYSMWVIIIILFSVTGYFPAGIWVIRGFMEVHLRCDYQVMLAVGSGRPRPPHHTPVGRREFTSWWDIKVVLTFLILWCVVRCWFISQEIGVFLGIAGDTVLLSF